MAIESISFCPLGHECESVKDGKIYKCAWYSKLTGKDPQTGEQHDEWVCSVSMMPFLMLEQSRQQLSTTAAVETLTANVSKTSEERLLAESKIKLIS